MQYEYDLTAERWVRPAYMVRQIQQPEPRCSVSRLQKIKHDVVEFLTVVAGLLTFSCIAMFFLLLA